MDDFARITGWVVMVGVTASAMLWLIVDVAFEWWCARLKETGAMSRYCFYLFFHRKYETTGYFQHRTELRREFAEAHGERTRQLERANTAYLGLLQDLINSDSLLSDCVCVEVIEISGEERESRTVRCEHCRVKDLVEYDFEREPAAQEEEG